MRRLSSDPITDLALTIGSCPDGYQKVDTGPTGSPTNLNGDLNQGAGGEFIYLCETRDPAKGSPVTEIAVWKGIGMSGSPIAVCPEDFDHVHIHRTPGATLLNGDLNQGTRGSSKDIL